MKGYDFILLKSIRDAINVPVTLLGGAGSLQDISKLINVCRVSGVAAGRLFVFKGAYKVVLINYPERTKKEAFFWKRSNTSQT